MKSYWDRQISRRRVLAVAGATGGGGVALMLVGCGSGGKGSGGGDKSDASGLVSKPVDTTSKAVKGGTYQNYVTTEAANFDAIGGNNASVYVQGGHVYSYLVRTKMVQYPKLYDGDVEPDAAASWEITPDGLQYTFKLRPNSKLDPRAPTNNRALDSQDVQFSWTRFTTVSSSRTVLSNASAADAPITSLATPDNSTVVMKLAFPYAPLLQMLTFYQHFPIMPREAAPGSGGFDLRGDMRGTGGWRLAKYQPSVSYEYQKNTDWFDADKILLDGLTLYIIPEYATGLAQFRAGNLWSFAVRQEDILQTKRDVQDLALRTASTFSRSTSPWLGFSNQPESPFRDDRVRKAVSMLVDRDLWIDAFFNVSNFTQAGLQVPTRWHSHVSAGEDPYWVDPKGTGLGTGAQFFKHDPAEAKKMLGAAGYTKSIESVFHYPTNAYGDTFSKQAQVLQGMLEANNDFHFKVDNPDYSTAWLPNYHYGNGKYDGIAQGASNTYPEIDGHIQAYFRTGSIRVWSGAADPQLDSLIDQQRRELDKNKRIDLVKQFQVRAAQTMPALIAPGGALPFDLSWPWIGNRGVWIGSGNGQQAYMYLWYDQSKKKAS